MKRILLTTLMGCLFSHLALGSQSKKQLISDFSLRWMNADDSSAVYNSADYQQSVFVIEGYFLNCPYCNNNAPKINSIKDVYVEDDRVQVLDVGRDCRDRDYATWIARHKPNHPVLNDCQRQVLGPLGITRYPTTVILDCNLNVVKRHVGEMNESTRRQLLATIEYVLKHQQCE